MKKVFIGAIMAIALMVGSATIVADNHCKTPCKKTEQCAKQKNCAEKKDCNNCTKECKAANCAECKCDKTKCKEKAQCAKQNKDCKKQACAKKSCKK